MPKRALAIHEKTLGLEHPKVAADLDNLASLYRTQGRTAVAEPLFERALAIYEQALRADHLSFTLHGSNLAAKRGAPVIASENGVVAYAGNELRGFGNLLLIKHSGGWVTAYAHNDKMLVKRGDKVRKGQKVATVGSTGSVKNPQLHFELRHGRKPTDPRKYLLGA